MSDVLSSVPREIQDQAARYADELWQALVDELGRDCDLEPIKTRVVGYLRLAFIRGTLDTVKSVLEVAHKRAATRSNLN